MTCRRITIMALISSPTKSSPFMPSTSLPGLPAVAQMCRLRAFACALSQSLEAPLPEIHVTYSFTSFRISSNIIFVVKPFLIAQLKIKTLCNIPYPCFIEG